MGIVDIHNHLTWGVDDGLESKHDTILALNQAKREGIKIIVASPHFIPDKLNDNLENIMFINERITELQKIGSDFDIQIIRGCEFFLGDDFERMLQEKLVNPIGESNYLLCEFDSRTILESSTNVEERLNIVQSYGYKVVLAHVERYFHYGLDMRRVINFKEMGCIFQINKSSILGLHGKIIQKNAFELIEKGYVHCIASDCHSLSRRDIKFRDVYKLIKEKYGKSVAECLFCINPLKIISNEAVDAVTIDMRNKTSKLRKIKLRILK